MPKSQARSGSRLAESPAPTLTPTNGAQYMKLRADQLSIDDETQRRLRPSRVQELMNTFDERMLGTLIVSVREDGNIYVVDGQHRLWTCIMRNEPGRLLDCRVHHGLTKAEEAEMFVGHDNVLAVGALDDFHVKLNYDEETIAIQAIVTNAGFVIGGDNADGTLAAVSALRTIYRGTLLGGKEPTPEVLAQTLNTLRNAWSYNRDAYTQTILKAIAAVHLRYGDQIDQQAFEKKLAGFAGGPVAFSSRAKILKEVTKSALWRAMAEVTVDLYNQGRRTSKLETFRP